MAVNSIKQGSPLSNSYKSSFAVGGILYNSVDDYVDDTKNAHENRHTIQKLYIEGILQKFLQNVGLYAQLENTGNSTLSLSKKGEYSNFIVLVLSQVRDILRSVDIFRIVSWNVNGIRTGIVSKGTVKCKEGQKVGIEIGSNMDKLEDLYHPDIICLQETKCGDEIADCFNAHTELYPWKYWSCTPAGIQKGRGTGYAGVSIWSKVKARKITTKLPGLKEDKHEGRVIIAEFPKFILINVYTPNSGTNEKYRLTDWDVAMGRYLCSLNSSGKKVILCGDMNVARGPIDVWQVPKLMTAGYLPAEQKGMEKYLNSCGMIDTFRELYGDAKDDGYTWWNPRAKTSRPANKGWRIDYFLTTKNIYKKVLASNIMSQIHGSDHCPIGLILVI